MTAATVLAELSAMGVVVVCSSPHKIRLTVDSGDVPAEAVALAGYYKPELIQHLRSGCTPHNNFTNYVDEPAPGRHGWTRTTCRVCGRFIGYRERSRRNDERILM